MDRYITYSRPDALGNNVAFPLDELVSATASNDNAMITLVFGSTSVYLNTKPGKAEKALEQLLSDVQHVYSPKMYDVSLAPNYNDVTGPKMFQNGGTLFVPDYADNVTAAYTAGAFTFTSGADVTNFSESSTTAIQAVTDLTATCALAAHSEVTELNVLTVATYITINLEVFVGVAYDITELTIAAGDTIIVPAFSVIDVKTGEVLDFPAYEYEIPA